MIRSWLVALGALLLVATLGSPAVAGQGSGNPRLEVAPQEVDLDRVIDLTVTGTDYLVPPHDPDVDVFGGVYVFFGWVSDPGNFGPSIRNSSNNDGTFGVTYLYPGEGGDADTRDDASGRIRLVSFTEGGESGEATDYHMDDAGNWTTTVRIYGSTFTSTVPSTGETITTDCMQVQCGVFTIGAHGKASATNEMFVPVSFAAPATTTTSTTSTTTTSTTTTTTTVPPTTSTTPGVDSSQVPEDSESSSSAPSTPLGPPGPDATEEAGEPAQGHEEDGPTIQLGVVSTRSTGGGGLAVAAVTGLVAAGAGSVWWWRKRRDTKKSDV